MNTRLQGTIMKHNIKIPGWNGQHILDILGRYASEVEEGGTIIELGALFGRSTYTLGHNKKDSVELITIDLWPTILLENHLTVNYHDGECGEEELALVTSKIKDNKLDGLDFYNLWKEYTKGIIKNIGIRSRTSLSNANFPDADFIFHDAAHNYKDVYADLVHWFPKLKKEGVLILDDYENVQFPELVKAVDQYVNENDLYTEMVTGRNILLRRK